MSRNSKSRDFLRFPEDVKEAADYVMTWALANSESDFKTSTLTAAMNLVLCNMRETVIKDTQAKPDGRTVLYGARLAAVHPESGDYIAAGPWSYGLEGMEGVWKYVADTAWQLYDGLEAMPVELTYNDLVERTNTARVAMSRRADGVAVVRVRFTWQKKFERKNIRRGGDPNEVLSTTWSPQNAQLNIWIGPNDAALAMDQAERAARHPLVDTGA